MIFAFRLLTIILYGVIANSAYDIWGIGFWQFVLASISTIPIAVLSSIFEMRYKKENKYENNP